MPRRACMGSDPGGAAGAAPRFNPGGTPACACGMTPIEAKGSWCIGCEAHARASSVAQSKAPRMGSAGGIAMLPAGRGMPGSAMAGRGCGVAPRESAASEGGRPEELTSSPGPDCDAPDRLSSARSCALASMRPLRDSGHSSRGPAVHSRRRDSRGMSERPRLLSPCHLPVPRCSYMYWYRYCTFTRLSD